ncbi:hypothetical protein [Leptospira paudalimensis]|uniref:Uncharacterized protein n=1 Tax=Leptospira paudalimensis TaxID=2950024 RepID=A0ABT3M813_9LEPT|nr:hypothetical protein [Leptospira paudalimensis]MCW7504519.1 hypothetical protein [Leptospira paudalimensis]
MESSRFDSAYRNLLFVFLLAGFSGNLFFENQSIYRQDLDEPSLGMVYHSSKQLPSNPEETFLFNESDSNDQEEEGHSVVESNIYVLNCPKAIESNTECKRIHFENQYYFHKFSFYHEYNIPPPSLI